MEFTQIVECTKNGLTMPKISSQSEQLAYLTVTCILDGFRNRTINGAQAKNQKEQAEQLFTTARKEEAARRSVWKNQQENLLKTEEILHTVNHELNKPVPDKDKAISLLGQAVYLLTGTKITEGK